MNKDDLFERFDAVGKQLLLSGLNSSHSGNLSVRIGDNIYITRSGAMLGSLKKRDIVEVDLNKKTHRTASMEYPLHREVYLMTSFKAVVHCHCPFAISLSLKRSEIVPVDLEGSVIVGKAPVIEHSGKMTDDIVAAAIGSGAKAVVVRGHGCFTAGNSLEEALHYASALELSAKILIFSSIIGHGSREVE